MKTRTRAPAFWSSVSSPSLFPRMIAKLSVYPLSREVTQLEFEGTYDPPLGLLGDAVDAFVGHRIAEASALQFLRDVSALLRAELAVDTLEAKKTAPWADGDVFGDAVVRRA